MNRIIEIMQADSTNIIIKTEDTNTSTVKYLLSAPAPPPPPHPTKKGGAFTRDYPLNGSHPSFIKKQKQIQNISVIKFILLFILISFILFNSISISPSTSTVSSLPNN